MNRDRLEEPQRAARIGTLSGWTSVQGRDAIEKTFLFADFKEAWRFMSLVAPVADEVGRPSPRPSVPPPECSP
jgi:4a-hydroxytetrahydrobiopterin dehydratase